jgi:hypothetical protein
MRRIVLGMLGAIIMMACGVREEASLAEAAALADPPASDFISGGEPPRAEESTSRSLDPIRASSWCAAPGAWVVAS